MRVLNKINVILFLLFLSCCSADKSGSSITIMSWNVENLFDDVDNGSEYYSYDPGNGNWDYDCFTRKASALADVITSVASGGADVVLLQEIENQNALEHLNTNYLKALEYPYICFFPTENSAIGTAVLSKIEIVSVNNHSVYLNGSQCGRNIAEINLLTKEDDKNLVVFINHWKSKLGGAEETEPKRIAASKLLKKLMIDASSDGSVSAVIAAGDFNESYDENSRVTGRYTTAINFFKRGDNESELIEIASIDEVKDNSSVFYNPWIDSDYRGSYCYNGSWETIDQFFLDKKLFDNKGFEYGSFRIVEFDFSTTPEGYPLGWDYVSDTGCSDHLPIMLTLDYLQ